MKKVFVIVLAIAMVFALAACGSSSGDHGEVLATVDGHEVYAEEYENYLGSYYQSAYGNYSTYQEYYGVDLLNEESAGEMLGSMEYYAWNVMIQASIIRDLAEEYNIVFEETFLEDWLPWGYFMGIKTSILYNDLVDAFMAEMQAQESVGDEEIQSAYDADPAQWDGRKTSHILLMCDTEDEAAKAEAYAKAVDLIARLNAGEDFATLAKENSDDSSATEGGVIDAYINVYGNEVGSDASFFPEYVAGAFELDNIGDFSQEPVLSSAGYHIIRIDDIRAGVEANKDAIMASLSTVTEEDATTRLSNIITERTENAVIDIKSDVFKYYVEEETEEGAEGEETEGGETDGGEATEGEDTPDADVPEEGGEVVGE